MKTSKVIVASVAVAAGLLAAGLTAFAADAPKPAPKDVIPHAQKAPPGPALSSAEAIAKMEMPAGFKVECVAEEPLVVNPTSFTWDDRGRIWVTESIEYPRKPSGKGQDRVKILTDTDGDGKMDKATIFKDGLNIPCGVVHGNGGVYVTNAPDILFLEDTNGDDVADKETVILTGFGRADTHELPNSLTWGPDGWLYGMNGVFNPATVKDPASEKVYNFSCAIWRYHPPTKRFELFAEGTSNPWGLDYNRAGEWFISCCVIDHMFHMTQSGYYHRQGGAYPPNVQMAKLPSITTQRHQAAAYAGLCIYDADAYPEEYRGRLIMGNLHGSALNQDVLSRNGSTYRQSTVKAPGGKEDKSPLSDEMGSLDFLQANDAWFMPVAQKIGPDGCIYVMDWYDRYHCYQDANRDPQGLDRLKGRIYRISHNNTPRAKPFDLAKASSDELLAALDHPNVWWRRTAQRLLNERHQLLMDPPMFEKIAKLATGPNTANNAAMHALWLLVSQNTIDADLLQKLLSHSDETVRAWAVRAVGNAGRAPQPIAQKLIEMATKDPSPSVRVQIPIAAGRLTREDPLPILLSLLKDPANGKDPLIPHITYMNLRPLAESKGQAILDGLAAIPDVEKAFGETTVKWIKQAIATSGKGADAIVGEVVKNLKASPEPKKAGQAMATLVDGLASLPIEDRAKAIKPEVRQTITKYINDSEPAARIPATTIALWWNDAKAIESARLIVADAAAPLEARLSLARTLGDARAAGNIPAFAALAGDGNVPICLRQVAIDAIGNSGGEKSIVGLYANLPAEMKPAAINTLTRSLGGASALLTAIENKTIPSRDLTSNHARSIQALGNSKVAERLEAAWGTIKTERDPERVKVVDRMKKVVEAGKGNASAGWKVFEARCAQCHTIYGKGGTLGPDLTGVGRDDVTAILTNVLDPNLVIGKPYYVNVARLKDGDVVSGLLVEESESQIVLKDQTRTMNIPRSNLQKLSVQEISFMPEGLEQQMSEQEFRDLVAFLLTREPPK
ncbi:PVC-type heme-binding CxxCH protein [Humisphaera borealis]|uniref:HEAT repeat domain-containing protein n=1 Tax=Humisphaera borealis TaxID=2807512 RepID=A0A7M2WT76_9BACT|nr:PVC-type heme-binding CxxCH protein [Humisphaera borealis]QOV88666.1 HEAT repeat domain-containing protein [Humisphaera borealis]